MGPLSLTSPLVVHVEPAPVRGALSANRVVRVVAVMAVGLAEGGEPAYASGAARDRRARLEVTAIIRMTMGASRRRVGRSRCVTAIAHGLSLARDDRLLPHPHLHRACNLIRGWPPQLAIGLGAPSAWFLLGRRWDRGRGFPPSRGGVARTLAYRR